jgi:single-stranded DNA-binding protein
MATFIAFPDTRKGKPIMITATVTGHVGTVKLASKTGSPEEGGFTVLNFTVASNAVSRSGKNLTNWVSCKLWGPRAAGLAKQLVSGQGVVMTGRPESRAYIGKDGAAKSDLVLHVDTFEFLGGKPDKERKTVQAVGDEAPVPTPEPAEA